MLILCDCNEGPRTRLDIQAIKTRLQAEGREVFVEKSPCRNGLDEAIKRNGAHSIVLGGCRDESYTARFRYAMRNAGLDPFAFRMVDLSEESSLDRASLSLNAAAERLRLFGGTNESNLKPRFGRVEGEMSRRQFFTLPRIQYDVVPSIENERCRSESHLCQLCSRKCDKGAIALDQERRASIHKDKCDGCGICVNVCPARAIAYPSFTPAEILKEIEALLERNGLANFERRSLLFICRESDSLFNDYLAGGGTLPEGVLPVSVPCIGMLNSFIFLHSVLNGCVNIGMLPGYKVSCHCNERLENVQREIDFTQAVLRSVNISGERVTLIQSDLSSPKMKDELRAFSDNSHALPHIPVSHAHNHRQEMEGPSEEYSLTGLLFGLENMTGQNILLEDYPSIPSGLIRLRDNSSCTLCGVCTRYCPAHALSLAGGNGERELMFSYSDCIGCAECVRRCPEKCLRVKRLFDIKRLKTSGPISLAKEQAVLCKGCGAPFLDQTLLLRIKERAGFSDTDMELMHMCPDCRAINVFSPPG
jgi:ferredoxin/coenzyme F420-reducing hydrogenase delta subunit